VHGVKLSWRAAVAAPCPALNGAAALVRPCTARVNASVLFAPFPVRIDAADAADAAAAKVFSKCSSVAKLAAAGEWRLQA
jgi:hypothetical protein